MTSIRVVQERLNLGSKDVARQGRAVFVVAALLAFLVFLSTLQWGINGSEHRYFTDVGEIQNALARWGTIHFTGYPQFTALGSLFVNGLRVLGVPAAAGASLFSVVWGAAAIGLLALLIWEFRVPGPVAVLGALLFALSLSMWVDGSIAELHTMTMALTFVALLMGVRFGRSGKPADLYWLVFISSQGVTHQRSFAFLAPALAVLVVRHWRLILQKWLPVLALALTGPITYLYLPVVDWLGSEWVFSAPGTWEGFWALVMDTKAERIISVPGTWEALSERVRGLVEVLNADWLAPLWIVGLLGVTFAQRGIGVAERAALALTWLVYALLSLIVWVGFVGDAILAAKMPVVAMAAVGLAFVGADVARRGRVWRQLALAGGVILALFLIVSHRGEVLALTRDARAAETIAMVEGVNPVEDGRRVTFVALWGNDFWQLAYAQAHEGRFAEINLVDHNANFEEILARGDRLLTSSRTFLTRPPEVWEERLGDLHFSMVAPGVVAPGVVEMRRKADGVARSGEMEAGEDEVLLQLENGTAIREASLERQDGGALALSVAWEAQARTDVDYSVAVHLVSADPPAGPEDVLAQADSRHPVGGWYPTSQWAEGEVVHDVYLLDAPQGVEAVGVRVGMYRVLGDGEFENTEMLSLEVS